MTPERWHKIEEIYQTVIDLPPAERAGRLTQFCADDTALRREIEALLAEDETADEFLQAPIQEAASTLQFRHDDELVGQDIGPYHIRRLLGQGGMGAVYLAERADDEYYRQVALKIVRRGLDSRFVLKRFRVERQILATLAHPNIAQLLDGGTTASGLPYLVMEYIDGQPLTEYCAKRQLALEDRLRLFLPVCAAVQHAHQKLVVHRDLKPSNILVTADGVPKLLDFGIAKLLDPTLAPDDLTRTRTAMRLMTPDYASPEQVRGLPITTASDVYALGAVLYELLTGVRPHQLENYTPAEIERAVCDTEIERPSSALGRMKDEVRRMKDRSRQPAASCIPHSASLKGDLDNIMLMALRKEPERRYQSVEQLAEDLRRYLAGRPISARRESLVYRAEKFVRRNKLGVAAAALILFSLLGGIVTTARAARVAERERARAEANLAEAQRQRTEAEKQRAEADRQRGVAELERAEALAQSERAAAKAFEAEAERRIADAQRAEAERQRERAERRFGQVRKLANTFLFDFHDQIATLPGSTAARELVVKTALEYLDSLAQEAEDDPALLLELVTAYSKVADVQGAAGRPNLGQAKAALQNYEKSLALGEKLLARTPTNEPARRVLAATYVSAGYLQMQSGAFAKAKQSALRGAALAERLPLSAGAEAENFRAQARPPLLLSRLAVLDEDLRESLRQAERGTAILEQWLAIQPSERAQRAVAAGYSNLCEAQLRLGDLPAAVNGTQRAIKLVEELYKAHPTDTFLRQDLQTHYVGMGDLLGQPYALNLGRPAEALAYYRRAVELCDSLIAADPNNVQALREQCINYQKMGWVMREVDPAESVRLYAKVQELSAKASSAGRTRGLGVEFQLNVAHSAWRAGQPAQARQHLREVRQALQEKKGLSPGTALQTVYLQLVQLLQEMGDTAAALDYLNLTLPLVKKSVADEPYELQNYADLAECYALLGWHYRNLGAQTDLSVGQRAEAWRTARTWYQQSLAVWRAWPQRAASTVFNLSHAEAMVKALAQCDSALAQLSPQR